MNTSRWSRTTGEALTRTFIDTKGQEHEAIGRKFKLTEGRGKRTDDTFVILALDHTMSNPKTFTMAKLKNDATGQTFWSRIQHNNGYMVPENQK
jgi:hypothetical protein